MARTAAAHAAWREAGERPMTGREAGERPMTEREAGEGAGGGVIDEEDIRVAARLALPHRRRRNPFDAPEVDEQQLDEALKQASAEAAVRNPACLPITTAR